MRLALRNMAEVPCTKVLWRTWG